MNKFLSGLQAILKYLWLITSMACLVIAIIELFKPNYKQGFMFLGFSLVAFYFYYTRLKMTEK